MNFKQWDYRETAYKNYQFDWYLVAFNRSVGRAVDCIVVV